MKINLLKQAISTHREGGGTVFRQNIFKFMKYIRKKVLILSKM